MKNVDRWNHTKGVKFDGKLAWKVYIEKVSPLICPQKKKWGGKKFSNKCLIDGKKSFSKPIKKSNEHGMYFTANNCLNV